MWDDLCSALVELGPPNELPKLSPMNSFEHHDYLDLMERYMHRNTDPVREMWTEAFVPLVSIDFLFATRKLTSSSRISQQCS